MNKPAEKIENITVTKRKARIKSIKKALSKFLKDERLVERYFTTRIKSLDNQTPSQLLETDTGLLKLECYVSAIVNH